MLLITHESTTRLYRSHVLYYAVIVTSKDIPAGTELTYDYGYAKKDNEKTMASDGRPLRCHCGAPNCEGQLLS